MNENQNFKDVLNKMLCISDEFLEANKEVNCETQKIMTLSAIIQFVKCGADLRLLPIQDKKIPVVIELKKESDINV